VRAAAWLCMLVLALAAGCGDTQQVREPDLVVGSGEGDRQTAPSTEDPARGGDALRIAVVTHGQASNPFWVVVRNGIDAAARQMDVSVNYESPDTFSVPRMRALIDKAVASRPDGLVVSIPSRGVNRSIRRAIDAGIPVITMNSGSRASKRLGALAHVGQPEARAGTGAARRFLAAGVRRALCVNQQSGNVGLDERCRAFARVVRRAGGEVDVLPVDVQDRAGTRQRLMEAIRASGADGVLTLDSEGAAAALDAVTSDGLTGEVTLATFDLSPEVLQAVRDGRILFAIDQQGYLQGYLPIVLLTQRIRYGLLAGKGEVIATGPTYVTRSGAGQVIRLSERGIR
jgi:simple sugar transport system substrate-binding protein